MIFDEIKELVEAAYGSLVHPNFSFVIKAERLQPYKSLVGKLEAEFEVAETTDLNDDVAFCYQCISKNGELIFGIRLSMVGRYAFVYGTDFKPLTSSEETQLGGVFEVLREEKVKPLSLEILEEKVFLALDDESEVSVFNALFSSVEELPWK